MVKTGLPARSPVPQEYRTKQGPTKNQESFIRSLLDQVGKTEADLPKLIEDHTKGEASALIDALMEEKEKAPVNTRLRKGSPFHVTEDGMYRTPDGTIFKVQYAVHGSGQLYAKKLVIEPCPGTADGLHSLHTLGLGAKAYVACFVCDQRPTGRFEYVPGAINRLRPEHRMTLKEAKEFGALYGTCCVCGRTLTREESIEAGIGPVCSRRGWQ